MKQDLELPITRFLRERVDAWTDIFAIAEACAEGKLYATPDMILKVLRSLYKRKIIEFRRIDGSPEWRIQTLEPIKGLGWHATTPVGGMFLDHRKGTRGRRPLVAWLNHHSSRGYFLRPMTHDLHLVHPIPSEEVRNLGDAVEWVYNNSVWREK